jgi:hypothetical protein
MAKEKPRYEFDDRKAAFAEAEERIQKALHTGATELSLNGGSS